MGTVVPNTFCFCVIHFSAFLGSEKIPSLNLWLESMVLKILPNTTNSFELVMIAWKIRIFFGKFFCDLLTKA